MQLLMATYFDRTSRLSWSQTRVRITIEPILTSQKKSESFLHVARSLNLEGPRNWSTRLDDYL